MHIHRDINNLPTFNNSVLTIGSFDGVHRGHQKIIKRINNLADEIDGESIIITFNPHPRQVIYPRDNSLQLLSTIDEKLTLFEKYGIDHVVIVPFSVEFSQQNPREYLDKFIISNFNPSFIVIGYDHRFGLNRTGDIYLLKRYAEEKGFKVLEIKKQEIEDITISSTKIRNALNEGDITHANMFLGHPYGIRGTVVHGDKIGKQLGFPTANISIASKEKLIPQYGIYAVRVLVDNLKYGGMLYIGNRPTINTKQHTSLEVNIFDFSEDIYDQDIEIQLLDFIRKDSKFNTLEALRSQLKLDKKDALNILQKDVSESAIIPKASIAILNFNGIDFLESYLPSVVQACPEDCEIVVIDNSSSDDSINFLEEWFPEIRIISLFKNYGFAGGYNKGIDDIESDFTLLLNSDVEVTTEAISRLLTTIESSPDIAAVQPSIRSMEDKEVYEYAGAAGGMMDNLGYPFCRGRVLSSIENVNPNYTTSEIFWASGAAMMVRTNLFKTLGGFDSDYFAHQEEIDFCWRAKRAGYSIKYDDTAIIYHLGGGTLAYENPKKTYLNFRNNLFTLLKNEKALKLLWLMPFRLLLDIAAAAHFITRGLFKNSWSVIKAYFEVFRSLRKYITKRAYYNKLINTHRIGEFNKSGKIKKSILWQFYVLGKKSSSEL